MKIDQIQFSNISTYCLLKNLLRNLWMIVASVMIFSMSTSLYMNWVYVPRYQASMTYAVTARLTSYTASNNITATREVSSVLTQMLESNMVYHNIRNHSEDLADFSGTIHASQVGESNMIVVTSEAESPEQAFNSIRAIEDLFPTIVGYVSSGAVVQVIRNPSVSSTPVNPVNTGRAIFFMGSLGAIAMIALLCLYSINRETIQTRTGARNLLDAKVIATVSKVHKNWLSPMLFRQIRKPLQVFSPSTSFTYTEQINTICAQMENEATLNGHKIFMVTGVGENEGKSTISGNIAAALSMMGKRVAIVDCDLRNPSLNRFFDKKYNAELPLNKLLSQPIHRENLLKCMVRHEQLGMYMLFPTEPDSKCTELLTGRSMQQLLRQLRVFDFVILDTPPMGYFTDTEELVDAVDASMLIVRQDRTPAADINDASDLLRQSSSHFMGIILNDMTSSLTEGHSYGYGYGKKYGYGYSKKYGYGYGYSKQHRYGHSSASRGSGKH